MKYIGFYTIASPHIDSLSYRVDIDADSHQDALNQLYTIAHAEGLERADTLHLPAQDIDSYITLHVETAFNRQKRQFKD